MSDALSYLVKARPEAMGHYLAFLKDSGKHLDPKTRDLISLITKVHAQTERGFRQYLKRALRDGCTPVEVLDALLMAFPALGLSRIIWAVDLILAMDLPGFQLGALQGAAGGGAADDDGTDRAPDAGAAAGEPGAWHDALDTAACAPGEVQRITCAGRGLFVYRARADEIGGSAGRADDAEWRVYDSRCPHETTDIPHLALRGTTLTCPKHEWVFDVRSGACIAKGTSPLRRCAVKVENGRLLVRW
jgi:nitrite reductase/ring-hydroxylating ferredoxin subunit